jgi:hypothetical protein
MSIHKRWTKYTKKNISSEPDAIGVYEIGDVDTGAILFIGEGKIRTSLLDHSPDGGRKKHVSVFGSSVVSEFGYRYEITGSKDKAKLRKAAILSDFRKSFGSLPRYNQPQKAGSRVSV